MLGFKFSLLNIYFWNVTAIFFFCIKFLPEYCDLELKFRILTAAGVTAVYLITMQITFVRHLVSIGLSLMWSFLLVKTLDYYFNVDNNIQIAVLAVSTVIFYIWHLMFMENPFNIIGKVSIEAPSEFSDQVQYIPAYIAYNRKDSKGSYITRYANQKKAHIEVDLEAMRKKFNDAEEYNTMTRMIHSCLIEIDRVTDDFNNLRISKEEAINSINEICEFAEKSLGEMSD